MLEPTDFAPEPPLDDPGTPYYVDLIAVLAGLMHAPKEYFSDTHLIVRRFSIPLLFAGGKQATNYLHDFIVSDKLIERIESNPLFRKLGVNTIRLRELEGEQAFYNFQFAHEGYELEPGTSVIKLLGNTFCTSMLLSCIERICLFQSANATRYLNELRKQRSWFKGREFNIIEVGISRSPSATITAYLARASVLAGQDRWMGHRNVAAVKAANETSPAEENWMIRWRKLEKRRDRKALIKRIGRHSNQDVDQLYRSGFLGFEAEELFRDDLYSFAMEGTSKLPRVYTSPQQYYYPQSLMHKSLEPAAGPFLVDKYYQEIISPADLTGGPLYGMEGLPTCVTEEGAPMWEALGKFKLRNWVRAKYWKIPVLEVENNEEVGEVVEILSKLVPDSDLLFRGQIDHYTINREPAIKKFLYGDPNVNELSLTTTASRADFDFDHFIGRFQLDLQGLIYADLDVNRFSLFEKDEEAILIFSDPEIKQRYRHWKEAAYGWEVYVMSIAQHYGIPTYGLDLTSDENVAIWMALNKVYSHNVNGKTCFWCHPIDRSKHRPVVYLVSTVNPDTDLKRYETPALRSVRQERQSAHLHFGGWGLHTNLCAEEVIAALLLGPNVKSNLHTRDMYPDVDEDNLYRLLLELRAQNQREDLRWGYERIVRWTPER
jgi:hypothetical protein